MYGFLMSLFISLFGGAVLFLRSVFKVTHEVGSPVLGFFGWLAITVGVVYLICWFMNTLDEGNKQELDVENVKTQNRKMEAVKRKLREMEPVLRKIFADRFPDIEEKLFASIKNQGEGLSGIAVDYPEIRSIEGLTNLAKELVDLYRDYYVCQAKIMDRLNVMRQRKLNRWYIRSWIPALPDDIAHLDDNFKKVDELVAS